MTVSPTRNEERAFDHAIINKSIPIPVCTSSFLEQRCVLPLDAIYIPSHRPYYQLAANIDILHTYSNHIIVMCSHEPPVWSNCLDDPKRHLIISGMAESPSYRNYLARPSSCNPSLRVKRDYDLPYKRTFALTHARSSGFRFIGLLDDDIGLTDEGMSLMSNLLKTAVDIVGFHVLNFPDVSTIDHIERYLTRRPSLVSIGGNCLFLDLHRIRGFFPYVYNEDWLFLLGHLHNLRIGSAGLATQRPHQPWTDASRIRFEQFGELIISGVKKNIESGASYLSGSLDFWARVRDSYLVRLNRLLESSRDHATWHNALRIASTEVQSFSNYDICTFISAYASEVDSHYDQL